MEDIQNFLESSTIHGLTYVSTTRKYVKLLWIFVVIGGFIAAGIMIYQSFEDWHENPVKTTIETKPMTEITFPKVTVCPPKNTYTDLNYDLIMTENVTLTRDTRKQLTNYALELLWEHMYKSIKSGLNKLQEKDRFYNWYHGYTRINLKLKPWSVCLSIYGVCHVWQTRKHAGLETSARTGTIFTQYYGDKFDASKVDKEKSYSVRIYPVHISEHSNATLHIIFEKNTMTNLTSGKDELSTHWYNDGGGWDIEHVLHEEHIFWNVSLKRFNNRIIRYERKVVMEDVEKQKLTKMPGFRLTWYYSGLDVEHSEVPEIFFTSMSVRNSNEDLEWSFMGWEQASFAQFCALIWL